MPNTADLRHTEQHLSTRMPHNLSLYKTHSLTVLCGEALLVMCAGGVALGVALLLRTDAARGSGASGIASRRAAATTSATWSAAGASAGLLTVGRHVHLVASATIVRQEEGELL